VDKAAIADSCLVVADHQPAGAFEFVAAAFNAVAQRIDIAIDKDWLLAVLLSGNDRYGPWLRNSSLVGSLS